ncbi:DUF721 domain-containing protein [Tianweitania sp. BSSL-BM11]|uniref:DUF721 domain-containing protein n=1 Tax=Tianweitania aestuarii TaxID=2814886 RepID=A0ABS5RVS6_9HYPH|nr:DciA family protein [Tianweitania aestuarii]MBS9719802.1 DUF721 domain-containing protein [Tianweitania aestuarii]
MAEKRRSYNAQPVSDLSTAILDPVLRRRAGISVGLVQSWEEIVGPKVAATSRPEKIQWPRRAHEDDPYQPATLIIACEGLAAMRIQHEATEIIGRINGYLGFPAIGRIKILQKPILHTHAKPKPELRPLTPGESDKLAGRVSVIEDEGLRQSLEALGRAVIGRRKRP